MSQNAHLLPEPEAFEAFVAGRTPLGDGPFWMINMLKFKSGGAAHYQEYERAIEPLMRAVGGKPIFRLYDNVRTVINGGGVVSDWDAIYIGAYPSPAKFLEFSTSSAYKLAHKHRVAALDSTEMYAARAGWTRTGARTPPPQPNWNMDMAEPERLAGSKTPEQLRAIFPDSEKFMEFIQDDRFSSGRVWQLNLLKVEPGEQGRFYAEYTARAQSHISSTMSTSEASGGLQMSSGDSGVWSLRGQQWSHVAIMQYPSRDAFVRYSQGSDSKENKGMKDGFVLRSAGLAIQGLVCLGPESDPASVQDPDGPMVKPTAALCKL